jgi:hypothetical protein
MARVVVRVRRRSRRRTRLVTILPRTKSWPLRVAAMLATAGQLALGALLMIVRVIEGDVTVGVALMSAMTVLAIATWRLRYWAIGLTGGVVAAAMLMSVFAFFPLFGFYELHPGPSVSTQLVRWLAFEAGCLIFLDVVIRHEKDLVRSL